MSGCRALRSASREGSVFQCEMKVFVSGNLHPHSLAPRVCLRLRALNWRERTSILEIELQEAREAASRYWSRQRALRHHVQKLKSQISCNSEGVLERRCGTQEHDR